jgi:hypothetical protein
MCTIGDVRAFVVRLSIGSSDLLAFGRISLTVVKTEMAAHFSWRPFSALLTEWDWVLQPVDRALSPRPPRKPDLPSQNVRARRVTPSAAMPAFSAGA